MGFWETVAATLIGTLVGAGVTWMFALEIRRRDRRDARRKSLAALPRLAAEEVVAPNQNLVWIGALIEANLDADKNGKKIIDALRRVELKDAAAAGTITTAVMGYLLDGVDADMAVSWLELHHQPLTPGDPA